MWILVLLLPIGSIAQYVPLKKYYLPQRENIVHFELLGAGIIESVFYEHVYAIKQTHFKSYSIGLLFLGDLSGTSNGVVFATPIGCQSVGIRKELKWEMGMAITPVITTNPAYLFLNFIPKAGIRYQKEYSKYCYRLMFNPILPIYAIDYDDYIFGERYTFDLFPTLTNWSYSIIPSIGLSVGYELY